MNEIRQINFKRKLYRGEKEEEHCDKMGIFKRMFGREEQGKEAGQMPHMQWFERDTSPLTPRKGGGNFVNPGEVIQALAFYSVDGVQHCDDLSSKAKVRGVVERTKGLSPETRQAFLDEVDRLFASEPTSVLRK